MHEDAQVGNLVHMLAVDFKIANRFFSINHLNTDDDRNSVSSANSLTGFEVS